MDPTPSPWSLNGITESQFNSTFCELSPRQLIQDKSKAWIPYKLEHVTIVNALTIKQRIPGKYVYNKIILNIKTCMDSIFIIFQLSKTY